MWFTNSKVYSFGKDLIDAGLISIDFRAVLNLIQYRCLSCFVVYLAHYRGADLALFTV